MKYCVIKNTTTIIEGSTNKEEVMLKNAENAGLTAEEAEILTEEEYEARKALEPAPIQEPTDKERIAQLEQIIDTMLTGGTI